MHPLLDPARGVMLPSNRNRPGHWAGKKLTYCAAALTLLAPNPTYFITFPRLHSRISYFVIFPRLHSRILSVIQRQQEQLHISLHPSTRVTELGTTVSESQHAGTGGLTMAHRAPRGLDCCALAPGSLTVVRGHRRPDCGALAPKGLTVVPEPPKASP